MDPLVGGSRKSWSKGASIQTRLLGKPSLAIDGKFQHHHKYSFTRSVALNSSAGVLSGQGWLDPPAAETHRSQPESWQGGSLGGCWDFPPLAPGSQFYQISTLPTIPPVQVELCAPGGGGGVYGLSLALTALNLARHSLTRPRVHVNIFF